MELRLDNVRIAYPNLAKPRAASPGQAPKFSATLIFPPDHPAMTAVKNAQKHVAVEKWGAKADVYLKELAAQNKLALHNGDEKASREGYAGNFFVNASCSQDSPPKLFHKAPGTAANPNYIAPEDAARLIYGGSYVNARIQLWAQDHPEFGRRINAQLLAVQAFRDGDAFARGPVVTADGFDDVSATDDNDVSALV